MDDTTYGGFIKSNIHNWILKECLQSGRPEDFFRAMRDEIEDIEESWENDDLFWEEMANAIEW